MKTRIAAFLMAFAAMVTLVCTAQAFTVSGRFLYEDRKWDKDGYTGAVQNLPIRQEIGRAHV